MVVRLAVTFVFLSCIVQRVIVQAADVSRNASVTFEGIFPPVFTPVDDCGNLNLDIIPEYACYLKQNGMSGVLVAGTAGECDKFTVDEKKRLIDAWLLAGRAQGLKVIAQVGGIPLPDAEELARYAQAKGVDAILTLPELYYKPDTPQKLVYFLKFIADAAPNTPLLYYHIPQKTCVNVDMVEVFELATKQIPSFAGMKIEVFEVALELRTKNTGDKVLIIADSTYLAPAVLMGFQSFIMTEFSVFPQLMKEIIDDGKTCELAETRDLDKKLQNYKYAISQGRKDLAPIKEAMGLVTGINVGQVRPPDMPLTQKQIQALESRMEMGGIKLYNK